MACEILSCKYLLNLTSYDGYTQTHIANRGSIFFKEESTNEIEFMTLVCADLLRSDFLFRKIVN